MKKRDVISISIAGVVLFAIVVSVYVFGFKFNLERHIIAAYPSDHASLREVLDYYKRELGKQGLDVEIRIVDEKMCDFPRPMSGLGGDAYLCLFDISDVFDTDIEIKTGHLIVVNGVGSRTRGVHK